MLLAFKEASPARQLGLAAFGAVLLCILLASVWFFFLRTHYGVLFSQLRVADSAAITAELDRKKIPYRLEDGGATILVPDDRVNATRLAVADDDLPLKGQVGFELFNNSDMGITEFAQKVNYQRALQGELARTIMTMDSVESARVHLFMSDRSIFRDDRVPSKASVTVLPRVGHRITVQAVEGIQRLVAAAVPDLDPSNVVVIDEAGRVIGDDVPTLAATEDPERRDAEQRYAKDIHRAIAGITSADPHVSVWAGLSPQSDASASQSASYGYAGPRRDFPLHVVITPTTPVTDAIEKELKRSALTAIAPAIAGDGVYVTAGFVSSADETGADVSSPAITAPAPASKPPSPVLDISVIALWAGFAAVVVAIAATTLSRQLRSRRLSEIEREHYVVQFQSLLNGAQGDA